MNRSNRRVRPPVAQPLPEPLLIERMADGGHGVAHLNGQLLVLDGVLPGDRVQTAGVKAPRAPRTVRVLP